jgi:predicted phage terminase large subunit-like protein
MKLDPKLVCAARRSHLELFLMKVFETLHPGEPPLKRDWYISAMCHALTRVHRGETTRQIITLPPRHLKSILSTVAFVAWTLGHNPGQQVIVAYYGLTLARHHCRLFRKVMESAWYQRDFPNTKIDSATALELTTTAGGGRRAVSVDSALTGLGADIIIIDDAMKASDARSQVMCDSTRAWFDNTLSSRINDKRTGKIISIQQRLSEADLTAYLFDKGFTELKLPAIAEKDELIPIGNGQFHARKIGDLLSPKRENAETLARIKREMGPVAFSAQYQQDPVTPEGNLIQMHWFGSYDEAPERHEFLKVFQSWDTGMSAQPTSDYTVCTTWGFHRDEQKWYLLDVFRQRLDYPDLKRAVIRLHSQWEADRVLIEHAGSGMSLWQEFRASRSLRPFMIRPATSKEERFTGCLGEVEAGLILLPNDTPWIEAFRSEIRAFPYSRHDDQVDSFSQFVNYQIGHWRFILTEHAPDGRPIRPIRLDRRPW